jgi:thioredoxin 1
MAKEITSENFREVVLDSKQPVLVDFWAQWCGPCKVIGPIVEELSNDYAGKAVVGKVDVDSNQALAAQFGIMNIPTILFFKDGVVVDKIKGAAPKKEFTNRLNNII